jgi:hypothetical protein
MTEYDQRADIWSFGIIVSEILQFLKFKKLGKDDDEDALIEYLKNRHIFKGNSCYPISPKQNNE